MKKNNYKVLMWGSKSQAMLIYHLLAENGIKTKYIFDYLSKKPKFKSTATFSNKKKELKKLLKKSNSFITCIGDKYGKARVMISKEMRNVGLKSINAISKHSTVDKTSTLGQGLQIMPGVLINAKAKIGDYCILNTNATIDHECVIGEGVHIMGSAAVSGRVKIGKYATIGTNATILPDLFIGEGAYVGAGAVVTNNVKKNQVVVGCPAKFIKINKQSFDSKILKEIKKIKKR